MVDRYGDAMGIMHIDIGNADLDLHPKVGDGRKLMKILSNEDNRKNKDVLFDQFCDYVFELIRRDYPTDPEEKIKFYIERNLQELFSEFLVRYGWTTKDELEKTKKESLSDIKKLMED